MSASTDSASIRPRAGFGVDVEDWYHAENVQGVTPRSLWNQCESRVEANVETILGLLGAANVRATFFILASVAERFPSTVIRPIADAGHEIASHGCDHRMLTQFSREQIREDLHRSKSVLEDLSGKPVVGYRAPSFSIRNDALDVMEELGYRYDSSLNPVMASSRYGKLDMSRFEKYGGLYRRGRLFEIPMSRYTIMGAHVPVAGGGYFRLFPYSIFHALARRVEAREGFYNFYIHPWEIDTGFPRLEKMRLDLRFRHYVNLHRTQDRLRRLLGSFRFGPLVELLPHGEAQA